MGLYRDETGRVIEIDDAFANARGYAPLTALERDDINAQRGLEARGSERGVLGGINAALTGAESALTLGGSDYLLGKTLSPIERERVLSEIDAHPYLRAGGEMAGALGGALLNPLARTPTGYLSNAAQQGVERGLAEGGIVGTGKALGYMGAEGAAQSVGQYIGHASLEDKEVTAEGLTGALGTGFAFGAGGGGAALGVANGLIAGRRLFSRVMAGEKAAQEAASTWTVASQEALEADTVTAQAAEVQLENIRKAKVEAQRARNESRSAAQEAANDAKGYREPGAAAKEPGDFEMGLKTDVIPKEQVPTDFEASIPTNAGPKPEPKLTGTPTSVFKKPVELEGPQPLIDVAGQPMGDGGATSVFKPKTVEEAAAAEGATKTAAAEGATKLEEQLAGTKAKLDEGAALKDIKGEKHPHPMPAVGQIGKGARKPASMIEEILAEKAAHDSAHGIRSDADEWLGSGPLSEAKKLEDIKGANELRNRRQETLREIRYKTTEDLLGPQMAKEEQRLADVMDEYNAARKDVEELVAHDQPFDRKGARAFDSELPVSPSAPRHLESDIAGVGPESSGVPESPEPWAGEAGTQMKYSEHDRSAYRIIDDAHEEALLRVKHAADPQEAGQALSEAEELEKLLENLDVRSVQKGDNGLSARDIRSPKGKQWIKELEDGIGKIKRYEKASAALADEVGERAHPVTLGKAKALRDAERESQRKVTERTARATDDVAEMNPRERAKAAKQVQIDAQRKLDELHVQHGEAKHEYSQAKAKVAEGEAAKKAALKEDKKLASKVGAGVGAQDIGGLLEMIDIPGLPKPSDLPIVGPLLGAWLKYRAMKKALGGSMGRVAATADARVAALASTTRDRVARAVDRSIGVMERSVKSGTKAIPPVAGILSRRIYDDGGPDPKKGAPVNELAAARLRELASYVHTPNAIERDVRRQLAQVTDPDLIAAAEKQHRAAMEFLLSIAPKMPEQNLLNKIEYRPSPAQSLSFARSYDAINDPAGVFERLAHEQAMISLEAAEALRQVYPRIFSEAGARLLEQAQQGTLKVPMRQRVQLSLLYKVPLDTALDPVNLKITQSVYDRKPSSPAYNPAAAGAPQGPTAQPAIANPVNLSQGLTPATDRSR